MCRHSGGKLKPVERELKCSPELASTNGGTNQFARMAQGNGTNSAHASATSPGRTNDLVLNWRRMVPKERQMKPVNVASQVPKRTSEVTRGERSGSPQFGFESKVDKVN